MKENDLTYAGNPFFYTAGRIGGKTGGNHRPYLLADQTKVWVRKAGRHNARWRYALLGMVARYLKLGVLKPVGSLGGEPAIATESKRLYELRSAGIAVPELLAVRKNALMFGNLEGIPLDTQIRQEAEAGKADAWLAGLEAIARVHKNGSSSVRRLHEI